MRTYLSLILAVLCIAGVAQKKPKPKLNKVSPAIAEGNYAEAKTIVDDAIVYEKTMNNPETWFLRGQVYAALDTANNEPGALEESLKSFDKALELDPEQSKLSSYDLTTGSVTNVDSKKQGYYAHYYNAAIQDYNDENFPSAASNFETAYKINPADTNAILNAAYAASAADLPDRAATNFQTALDAGSTDMNIFLQLYNHAIKKKDLEGALALIQQGREVHPDDVDLMKYEVNLFIELKRTDEASAGLKEAIAAEPTNPDLLFALGVFIFNEANELNKKINSMSYYPGKRGYKAEEKKEYDETQAQITAKLEEARPIWDKLYTLDSSDETVLETLAYIYKALGDKEKSDKFTAELEAVRG